MSINIPERIYNALHKPSTNQTRGRSGLYPSEASVDIDGKVIGSCHRASWFRWNNYKPSGDINPDWSMAAIIGEWYHDGIVNLMRSMSHELGFTILAAETGFFDPNHMISGRIDFLMRDNKTGKLQGIDTKSVGEFKGKKCIEWPSDDHVLQCAVYLKIYQDNIAKQKDNSLETVDKWGILYISRDENWDLKKKAHGSFLQLFWQFDIEFEKDIVVVTNSQGAKKKYSHISVSNLFERYKKLLKLISTNSLPDREFERQYSEEKIVDLHKAKEIQFKKDQTVIDKWLKNGAPEGELGLKLGDSQCMFCSYQEQCYSEDPLNWPKDNVPLVDIKSLAKPEQKSVIPNLF